MSEPVLAPAPEPTILVIFGITGDLAQRKLLPALYHLVKDNLLHEHTVIVGTSRQELSVDDLLAKVELCVLEQDNVCDPDVMREIRGKLRMFRLDPAEPEGYGWLKQTLDKIEDEQGMCMNRMYYLSIPPAIYEKVVHNLGSNNLNTSCQHGNATTRLLVEKPFGRDVASAQALIEKTEEYFDEDQIFRIDHYLAKESAQNILTFRRHNPVFADSWKSTYISEIRVLAHEKIGVEGRAHFYENVGALRDLVQSHLLQLLTLVMLDVGGSDDDVALHSAKDTVLSSLAPTNIDHVIRGQYEGYREEVGNPSSTTETYVRLTLASNLARWEGTNIIIETGKALAAKRTEIQLDFTDTVGALNTLTFRIQPNEGIDLQLTAKKPGFAHETQRVTMDFSYNGVFDEPSHPDAYERVLVDAVKGDHSLFATSEEVIASWRALQPIIDYWQEQPELVMYKSGSEGPEQITA